MWYDENPTPQYDQSQICLNGHVVTDMLKFAPARSEDYCSRCGARTIDSCPNCAAAIRGHYHVPGVYSAYTAPRPAFCHGCGHPFPWTDVAIEAVQELAAAEGRFTAGEAQSLVASVQDIVAETPRTQVAMIRYRQLMSKASQETASAVRDILVDIVAETVKRTLFGAQP